jgi:hypothetical protein
MRDQLRGTVVQPAEEGIPPGERGGAALRVEEGVLRSPKVDAILGLHVNGSMDSKGRLGAITYEVVRPRPHRGRGTRRSRRSRLTEPTRIWASTRS